MQAPWSFRSGRVLTVERGFFRRRDGAAAADTQTTSAINVCTRLDGTFSPRRDAFASGSRELELNGTLAPDRTDASAKGEASYQPGSFG
jgi:hypothetical protein